MSRLWGNQRLGLVLLTAALVAIFGTLRPAFFDSQLVLFPLLRDITVYTVVGLSQLCVLGIGHMNLAVGRMAAFSAMIMGLSYQDWHFPWYAGLAVGLVAGAALGALAGWIVARTGVNSFVVTLAMDFALLGLVPLLYSAWTQFAAFTVRPAGLLALREYSLADLCVGQLCGSPAIPQLIVFALVAMALVGWVYGHTRLGRELLMTGSNAVAAELSGIPTRRRIITAHLMSGLLAGLAGFLLAVSTGSFNASLGSDFLLPSFLGPILGGTLLAGGVVSVVGTALGTAVTLVIREGLELLGVDLGSLNIYLGIVLLVALSFDRFRGLFGTRSSVVR